MKRCSCCGKKQHKCGQIYSCRLNHVSVHVHHITPRKYGGSNLKSNLVDLCSKCHGNIHRIYAETAIREAFQADEKFFQKCLDRMMLPAGAGPLADLAAAKRFK